MTRLMKDSGLKWAGNIPDSWNVITFGQAIDRLGTGLNPRDNFELTKDDDLFYVTIRNFENGKLLLDNNCDRISKKSWDIIQSRSDLHADDILFASISEEGKVYRLVDEPTNWNINESVFSVRFNKKYFDSHYAEYLLQNKAYYEDLRIDATGTTFKSIKQNKLRLSRLVMPPIEEQQRIANYLDAKVAKIDESIEKTKATIEEYKALKQSIITKAVTKGIRGDRPMKDSGIEWIGEIPEEWELSKLKHNAKTRNTKYSEEYGVLKYFALENIESWTGRHISTENEYDISQSIICESGDIAFGKLRPYLAKVYSPNQQCCCSSEFAVFFNFNGVKDFFKYLFLSYGFIDTVDASTYGTKMPRANIDFIKNIAIPVPTINEQKEIAEYLDEKCYVIDGLIKKKEQIVSELESYKKSLIYEYVTGKKEVPKTWQ